MYFSPFVAEIAFWARKTSSALACSAAGLLATRPAAAVVAWARAVGAASGAAFGVGCACAVPVMHSAPTSTPVAAKTTGRLRSIEESPPGRVNQARGRGRAGSWGREVVLWNENQNPVPEPREQATNVRSYLPDAITPKKDNSRYWDSIG